MTCRDSAKAAGFSCSNYVVLRELSSNFDLGGIQIVPKWAEEVEEAPSLNLSEVLSKRNAKFANTPKKVVETFDEDSVDDNFILTAMKDAYDPLTNSVRDLKIDDRDLVSATNYFDFCNNVAGKAIKTPFARQLWIAYNLLGEFCPRCTPKKLLSVENVPVDMDPRDLEKKAAILVDGICPRCNASKAELVLQGDLIDFNQLAFIAGQRAGKSSFASTIAAYILHRYLKAPRLSQICRGIQDFTPLTFTFVGITAARSIKLLWSPLNSIVEESPWFNDYFAMLKHAGHKHDKEFFQRSKLFMRFYHKNIDLYPSSPLKRTLRGDTRVFASCLSGSTKVLTTEGWQRIDSDLTGKTAIVNGEKKPIVGWAPQGKKMVFRLALSNGLSLDATIDHKVRVWRSGLARFSWVELGSLTKGHLVVCEDPQWPFRVGSTLSSLEPLGEEEVFDISIRSEEHCFNANGIAVKNCDELSWFPYKIISNTEGSDLDDGDEEDERERANADEVHQALEASLTTIRTEVLSLYKKGINVIPTGINLNISSPQSEMDKLSRIYRETVDDPRGSLTLALRLPTWETSPIYTRDHPIIAAQYRKNAQKAERDFGANPPKLSASVLKIDKVLPLFNPARPNCHRILYDSTRPEHTLGKIVSVLPKAVWNAQILALDAGLKDNSFALCLGERIESRIKVNSVLELIPRKGTEIHFPSMMKDIVMPLIEECNVAIVAADRWNSINFLQQINDDTKGKTIAFQKTLTKKNLQHFIATMENGNIEFPAVELNLDFIQTVRNYKVELLNSPVSHLLLQSITVREYQGTITKGEGFTDDIFRTVALLHALAFNPSVAKKVAERQPKESISAPTRSGVFTFGRSRLC